MVIHNICNCSFRELTPFFWLSWTPGTHGHIEAKHLYIRNKIIFKNYTNYLLSFGICQNFHPGVSHSKVFLFLSSWLLNKQFSLLGQSWTDRQKKHYKQLGANCTSAYKDKYKTKFILSDYAREYHYSP